MEINNNPALGLIPVILGEKNAVQPRKTETVEIERTSDRADAASQQLTRVIGETEKQAAKELLQNETSDQKRENLFREQSSSTQNRAISAYLETEQAEQNNYLSDVLGIDVYT